jgi:hypothetical protein
MSAPGSPHPRSTALQGVALGALSVAWAALRLPLLALLVILEPVVKVLLAGSALLIVLTAVLFSLLEPLSRVPLGGMLAVAAGLVLLLALYYSLLRLLGG